MVTVGTVDCKIVVAMMMVGTVDWDTDDDDNINTLKPESMYTLLPAWKEYKSIINNVPDQQQQLIPAQQWIVLTQLAPLSVDW